MQAEQTAKVLLDALRAMGEGWHNRAAIAGRLGKARLNPAETMALDLLASQGVIERRAALGSRPNVNQWQYRIPVPEGA